MADKWPLANGLWSNAANWNGGTLPDTTDDVYCDGKTLTVDVANITVGTLRSTTRSGGTVSGFAKFAGMAGQTFTATNGFHAGAINLVQFFGASGHTLTLNGNMIANAAAAYGGLIYFRGGPGVIDGSQSGTSGGTLTFNGNVISSTGGGTGVSVYGNGVININGSVISSTSGGSGCIHIINNSTGVQPTVTINIVGDVYVASPGTACINNQSSVSTTINITGNVGYGVSANSTNRNFSITTGAVNITITGSFGGGGGINGGLHNCTSLTVNGNVTGAAAGGTIQMITTTSTVTVNGDVIAGVGAITAYSGTGVFTVNGNVVGGAQNAIYCDGLGHTVTVNGNVVGGSVAAINVITAGTVIVNGTSTGGELSATAYGVSNTSTGNVTVRRAKGNNGGPGAGGTILCPGVFATRPAGTYSGKTCVQEIETGPYGAAAIGGVVFLAPTAASVFVGTKSDYTTKTLYASENSSSGYPSDSDVRFGTTFDGGARTGSCRVPAAGSVALGVPVDATTGTAVLTGSAVQSAIEAATATVVLAASQPNYAPAKAGDAMTLTAGERTAFAGVLESAMLNEADGAALLAGMQSQLQSIFDAAGDVPIVTLVNLIVSGVWTNATRTLSAVPNVTVGGYASGQSPADLLSGTVTKVATVDDLLAELTEVVASVTRFKAAALSQAPAGGGAGGTDWTSTEREQIRYRLGLNGTATAPTSPTPTPITITPGPIGTTTGWALCVSASGTVESGIACTCRMATEPSGDAGRWFDGVTPLSATSDANGVVQFSGLIPGATYYVKRGANAASEISVTIPATAGATTQLPSLRSR